MNVNVVNFNATSHMAGEMPRVRQCGHDGCTYTAAARTHQALMDALFEHNDHFHYLGRAIVPAHEKRGEQ